VSIFFTNNHIPHQIAIAHAALGPCHPPPDYNVHHLIIILPLQAVRWEAVVVCYLHKMCDVVHLLSSVAI
jgi:hypothetical protein